MANADLMAEMLIRALVLNWKDVPKSTHAPLCITEDLFYLDIYDMDDIVLKERYERKFRDTQNTVGKP